MYFLLYLIESHVVFYSIAYFNGLLLSLYQVLRNACELLLIKLFLILQIVALIIDLCLRPANRLVVCWDFLIKIVGVALFFDL